jgi:integrase/recombinase XerD
MSPSTLVPAPESLDSLATLHLDWLRATGAAPSTLRQRRSALAAFVRWATAEGATDATHFTLALLERYQIALSAAAPGNGPPPASCGLALGALRRFGQWLLRTQRLATNPAAALVLPRRPRRLPRLVLGASEMERVLALPDIGTPLGLRDRAILETLYSTGVRRRELLTLRVADLDLAQGLVTVRLGKGGRDRVVPIGARAAYWVGRYQNAVRPAFAARHGSAVLFLSQRGRALRENRLSEMVQRYIGRATDGKRGSCHVFRHSMATLLLDGGADLRVVQEILGHAHLTSTALYTHVAIGRIKAVHAAVHPAERAWRGAA